MGGKVRTSEFLLLSTCGILLLFWLLLRYMPYGVDYYYSFYPSVKNWQATGAIYTGVHFNPPWLMILLLPMVEMTFLGGQAALITITFLILIRVWWEFLPQDSGWAGPVSLAMSIFNLYNFDLLLRVQVDGFILIGLFLMVVALRRDRPHLLGVGWVLAAVRPSAIYLYGVYSVWVAYTRGYLWRALWTPTAVFLSSFIIFGNWITALYDLYQRAPPYVTWQVTIPRIGSYYNLPVLLPLAVMVAFGAVSFWVWIKYAARVDEPTRIAFLIATSLVTTPYALSYHYSIVFPIILAVLLSWRLWLCIPIYLTTFFAVLRVPFGPEVAWVDIAMPVLVWVLLVLKMRAQVISPVYQRWG